MSEPSIFTRIVRGEIPCHKIYEDDETLAFLDIHPITPGHTLVIPKKQFVTVWEMDDESYGKLMQVTKWLAQHLQSKLGTTYIGEQIVGVDVPHAHIHLIPFSAEHEFQRKPDMNGEPDHELLANMAKRLLVQ